MPDKNLRTQTPGEKLWIWRRKHRLTQAEAAGSCGLSERCWNMVETDRQEWNGGRPFPRVRVPGEGHLCALARRRDGRTLRRLAVVLGAGSHVTLLAWERTADPRLVRAWKGLGYRF